MKRMWIWIFAAMTSVAAAQDKPGCETAEPAYMTRMPGFFIRSCKFSEFNTITFKYRKEAGRTSEITVSGIYRYIAYAKIAGEPRKFSGAQILNNYVNAVNKAKGEVLSVDNNFFKLSVEGRKVYFRIENAVDSDDLGFDVVIIEEAAMKQDIVISMKEAIDSDGKIALYGILFDVNKSVIKPESSGALQTIVDYLEANPLVKIVVVGHTDNTGILTNNLVLSKDRAQAVKNYLVNTGKVDATRLDVAGVGSWCPVSTNDTEKGRALNRRVEIVKQ